MTKHDVRWQQRYNNYQKALERLEDAVNIKKTRAFNELEKQGVIQAFEYTFELAWNVMKDYLSYQGVTSIIGARDAIREAFQNGLIEKGQEWMKMLESRNLTSHAYNEVIADEVVELIFEVFFPLFVSFKSRMSSFVEK